MIVPEKLNYFIERTLDKYPRQAKEGLCWISNMPITSEDYKWGGVYYIIQRKVDFWKQKGLKIVCYGCRKDLPCYDYSGGVIKDSYPLFIDCGDKEILDKLGYVKPVKIKWAQTEMTKNKSHNFNRFSMMDLDDD